MRLLKRNLTEFEYLPYEGESDLDPDTGMHTGEMRPQYGDPIPYEGNISVPSGYVNPTFYGADIRYTHTLVMEPPGEDETQIDEHGLIRWRGNLYEIRAVRESLNVLSVALRRRTGNHGEPYEPDEAGETGETVETGETGGDGE